MEPFVLLTVLEQFYFMTLQNYLDRLFGGIMGLFKRIINEIKE